MSYSTLSALGAATGLRNHPLEWDAVRAMALHGNESSISKDTNREDHKP